MSKDFANCKKEVVDVLLSCLAYLNAQKLARPLFSWSTKNDDELLRKVEDTLKLIAPELMKEAKDA